MSIEIHRKTGPTMAMQLMALNGAIVQSIRINEINLDKVDAFPDAPSLTKLEIMYSITTKLPINLPISLIYLNIPNNGITKLPDKLPCNLRELDCSGNNLTELPPLPDGLISLDCSYNNLMVIPKLPKTLEKFMCNYNHNLTTLPDELPPKLRYFEFKECKIDYIPYLPYSIDFSYFWWLLLQTYKYIDNNIRTYSIYLHHPRVKKDEIARECIDFINKINAPERAHRRCRAINRNDILLETYMKRAMHPKRIADLLADENADVDTVMQEYTAGL
jgi:hypothetical protein